MTALMHVLYIDMGNSRTKWRVCRRDGRDESGAYRNEQSQSGYRQLLQKAAGVETIWLSSVAAGAASQALVDDLLRDTGVQPFIVKVERECLGLQLSYPVLGRLGVDRWLAMLAAWTDCRSACCVLDLGTAINVEFVSGEGRQVGGLIAPGSYAMMQALYSGTALRQPETLVLPASWAPQNDTQSCVQHGLTALLHGLFYQVEERCQRLDISVLYLCGGDASLLAEVATERALRIVWRPHLVLDGLQALANNGDRQTAMTSRE